MGQDILRPSVPIPALPAQVGLQGDARGDGYWVRLRQTRLLTDGESLFPGHTSIVEYVIESDAQMEVSPRDSAQDDYQSLAGISFFPAGTDYYCRWRRGTHRSMTCRFDAERLLHLADRYETRRLEIPASFDMRHPGLMVTMRRLTRELLAPGFASDLQIQCLITSMVIDLARMFNVRDGAPGDNDKLTAAQIRILRELIEESGHPPSLADMADACLVSARRLSVLYRNTCNRSLRSYVAATRIERAQALLLDGDLMIKQVAHASGFQNAAAFTAAFRRSTGCTPAQFRDARRPSSV